MGLSRDLARWIAGVKYEDLPADVVDRAKGVTLHGLTSALLGSTTPGGKEALELMREEEAGGGGNGTVWVDGGKLTRGGAAFVNAEMQLAGGKWDTYRMLTHPGVMIMPAAMVACEATGASGKDYITGIVCGYEVLERIARDFVPQIMSQGFHTAPVIGIIGAAVAAAKIYGFDEDRINGAIAQCANFAAGNLESGRSGGSRLTEGGAVRNALLAVALARRGRPAGETVLEGDAGFFAAYAGNNKGELDYHFEGQVHANIAYIADGLGSRYEFLNTIYRLYGVAGYNIAHIDTVADLVRDNGIKGDNIDRIEAVVNRHETVYPSAAFPAPTSDNQPRVGSTHYLAAWSALGPGYPLVDPKREDAPAGTLELMNRVTLIPSDTQTLFGPEVTIYTKDGKKFTKKATGREFIWDFDNEVRRLNGVQSGLPISAQQFDALTDACRNLDRLARADELIGLTAPPVDDRSTMDLGLKNKRALVTGASSGIGRSCAIELAAEGARVCCTGRDQARLDAVVQECKAAGGDAFGVIADLSSMEGCESVMAACVAQYGGIDVLINNAGAAQNVDLLSELTTDYLDDALGLKTYSFLRLSKLAFPHMQKQRWGRIVNIAGAAGTSPTTGNLAASFANVTILNLTRAFQDAGAADGILVNTICPGATNTPRTRHHRVAAAERAGRSQPTEEEIDAMIAQQGASLPAGRMCEPEEVAKVAAFLSSEACSYVQASAIYMDGGSRRSTP